jgi:ABC-2 type transport system permease protein
MLVVGFIMGFRPKASLTEWLVIIGLLALFTFTFSWLAVIVGVKAKSVEAVQWLSFVIVFPLTFASSAFVQTNDMNKYLKAFAENQPITHVIEAIRSLMLGTPVGNHVWLAIAWCLGVLLVAVPLSIYLYNRKAD